MRKYLCTYICCLMLGLLTIQSEVVAQADSTTTTNTEQIPLTRTQVTRRIEQVTRDLIGITSELNRDNQISAIRNEFELYKPELQRYVQIGTDQLATAGINRLQDFILIQERLESQLNDWQEEVLEIGVQLDENQRLVDNSLKKVDSLADSRDILNNVYVEHLMGVRDQLNETKSLLEDRAMKVLNLQIELSDDYVDVLQLLNRTKDFRERYWERLMTPDSTGLVYQSSSETRLSTTVWRVASFFQKNPKNTIFFLAVLFSIYMGLRSIKRKDPDQQFSSLYSTRLPTAMLLGFLLFPIIFPPTTTLMYNFMLVVTYVPFIFILGHPPFREQYFAYLSFFIAFLVIRVSNFYAPFIPDWVVAVIYFIGSVVFLIFLFNKKQFNIFNPRWKVAVFLLWLLKALVLLAVVLYFTDRAILAKIVIESVGDTIALGLVILYIGYWMDHLIDFLRTKSWFSHMYASEKEIGWTKWRNFTRLVLLILFMVAFAHYFHIDDSIADSMSEFLSTERAIGSLTFNWGGIFLFVFVLYASSKLAGWVKFFTTGKAIYGSQKKTGTLATMIRFGIILAGFLLALFVSGIPLDKLTIILGALSVGLGFGLQNIVNNLVSGIILIFERPVQVGDMVNVKTYMGIVKEIGIRASIVKTFDGAEVIIPNGHLISEEVINWTLSDQHRRVEVLVGVAYGSDVDKVKEVLGEVVSDFKGVLKLPKPMVLFQEFGDSSLNFSLRFWVSNVDDWLTIKSDITSSLYHALAQAKIEIPFPQRDLHLRSMSVDDLKKAMSTTGRKK